jgi:hypothetical protein
MGDGAMQPVGEWEMWAGRLCLGLAGVLGLMGFHFGNIRFLPMVAGFALLAVVCYIWRAARTSDALHPGTDT